MFCVYQKYIDEKWLPTISIQKKPLKTKNIFNEKVKIGIFAKGLVHGI